MIAAEVVPGDRVTDGRRTGLVRSVGECGHPPCRWGAECVTVDFGHGAGPENRAADQLRPAEPAS